MKKLLILLLALFCLVGCGQKAERSADIAATTGPVYQFTQAITQGTGLTVRQVISDQVSCLHDYSLSVSQMKALEACQTAVISGGGLEDFMANVLEAAPAVIDCSQGIALRQGPEGNDPHIWLDPQLAVQMAQNLADGLAQVYPEHADAFQENLQPLTEQLEALARSGHEALADLSCRQLITFHDGFEYLAAAFDLEILAAMEEEAGSEVSAADLSALVELVNTNRLPAVFTEKNGSSAAASVLQAETGVRVFELDMAMTGDYFAAMTHNIDTLREALQ